MASKMASRKKIPPIAAAHIARLLAAKLDEDFGPKDPSSGKRRIGQRAMCKRIGIAQPVLKDLEEATGSAGINALIALRKYLKAPIDEILGLGHLPGQAPSEREQQLLDALADVRAELRALREREERRSDTPPPPPTKAAVVRRRRA